MRLAVRELPQKIRVHCAECELPGLGLLSRARDVVQDPLYLRGREIRVQNEPGFLVNIPGRIRNSVAVVRRPPALPYYGVVHGPSGLPVPDYRGLPLVRDAYRGERGRVYPGAHQDLAHDSHRGRHDVSGSVLHPAGAGVNLREFALRLRHGRAGLVEDYRPRAGRALVYGENVLHGPILRGMRESLRHWCPASPSPSPSQPFPLRPRCMWYGPRPSRACRT